MCPIVCKLRRMVGLINGAREAGAQACSVSWDVPEATSQMQIQKNKNTLKS